MTGDPRRAERERLAEADAQGVPWRRWGPYLSERQWGTVREDYGSDGEAWSSFTHDQARSRAYRWGEDGIAGVSDDRQRLCLALALWNGRDPILKERMFGLTNVEGNHGEDVKEYYFYLDSTPTHSYMKYLYKYPQAEFPYADLVATNRARGYQDFEYELLDTGVFGGDRYFDVIVEYAKAAPEDLLMAVTIHNRGPEPAPLWVLPTLWYRHTWSWAGGTSRPQLRAEASPGVVAASDDVLGPRWWYCDATPELLFTDNETNDERIFGSPNATPYVKDGIDRYVVHGETGAVNPARQGTKAAALYTLALDPGQSTTLRLRLSDAAPPELGAPFGTFPAVLDDRRREADEHYDAMLADGVPADERSMMRQAVAGMLWTKQYYELDVERWLREHGAHPPARSALRNSEWFHMSVADVISMPDKWEYPWFAAWDLAFHAVTFAGIDPTFAKSQLALLLRRTYLHPNGQLPAYEWNFGDVNPPVHAWATWFVYQLEQQTTGRTDRAFLENSYLKLVENFTWWLNRKDVDGRNVFQGGFLGLDNIGVFDRSAPLPTGGHLDQADGTAWMALYCQNMLQMALELAKDNPVYEEQALAMLEHFAWIAAAMNQMGDTDRGLWDEEDGFFYDLLRLPDGSAVPLKVRSMVGLLPLAATSVFELADIEHLPDFRAEALGFAARHESIAATLSDIQRPDRPSARVQLSLFSEERLRRILARMLDEAEFLGPHGLRAVSRYHAEHPYSFRVGDAEYAVAYRPAESDSGMFGGNSNWRGPVWFPMNALIIRALLNLYLFYGDSFTVECPTGSGRQMTLYEVARHLTDRLTSIFLRGPDGTRPVHGGQATFQHDPHWRDLLLFYEYFHGDNGAGLGASHQTGWTGTVALLSQLFHNVSAEALFEGGRRAIGRRLADQMAEARQR